MSPPRGSHVLNSYFVLKMYVCVFVCGTNLRALQARFFMTNNMSPDQTGPILFAILTTYEDDRTRVQTTKS